MDHVDAEGSTDPIVSDITDSGQLRIKLSEARRFLELLAPGAALTRFAFQTFDDDKRRKDEGLAKTLFGTLDEAVEKLVDRNRRGAGVFAAPNEFRPDAKARTNANVIGRRCCWQVTAGPLTSCEPAVTIAVCL